MICKYCGGELVQEAKFCTFCGGELMTSSNAPIEKASMPPLSVSDPIQTVPAVSNLSVPPKSKGRYLLFGIGGAILGAVLLAVILFATGVLSSGSFFAKGINRAKAAGTSIEGAGYDTPEEAAKAYLEALKNQDLDAMLATFAVESYVDNYDFAAGIERLRSYNPNDLSVQYPNTCEFTKQMNIASRREGITRLISRQYLFFNVPEVMKDGRIVTFDGDADMQDFISALEKDTENYIFEDLEITGTIPPEDLSDLYLNEKNQKNIDKRANVIGVDGEDVANVVITFDADGKSWVFSPQLVRYDNKWYIEELTGNVAILIGLPVFSGGISIDQAKE